MDATQPVTTVGMPSLLSPGGIATAGIGVLGQLAQSAFNISQQNKTNETEIDLANTAHQREVKDLKAAGLNPILSVNKGASVPGLSAPESRVDTNGAINSAAAAAQIKNTMAQTESTRAQTQQLLMERRYRLMEIMNSADASTLMKQKAAADLALTTANANSVQAMLPEKQMEGAAAQALGKGILPWIKDLGGGLDFFNKKLRD
jgi:hypothetical protein